MSEYYEPNFIGGPRDGASVPMALWVLDDIEMIQKVSSRTSMIYLYKLDSDTKNYIYQGQREESNE